MTTAGQRHDSLAFDLVLDRLRVQRPGRGRPRRRPDAVLADKAYSSKAIRSGLGARGIRATIPLKTDQQAGRRGRKARGRLPAFDPVAYRDRNAVERAINKLRGTPRDVEVAGQASLPANRSLEAEVMFEGQGSQAFGLASTGASAEFAGVVNRDGVLQAGVRDATGSWQFAPLPRRVRDLVGEPISIAVIHRSDRVQVRVEDSAAVTLPRPSGTVRVGAIDRMTSFPTSETWSTA